MPNNIDINIRSEEVQDVLEAVPHWMIRYGNLLLLALIILLLFISWFIKYPDIITSEAVVTTKIPPQKIVAQLTSKLDTIFTKDNQLVKKGEVISVLENTANFDHIQLLKSVIDTINVNNENFSFPINDLPIMFLGEVDTGFAVFENNYIQYLLNKELQPFSNEQNGNKFSKFQLNSRLKTLEAQKQINQTELKLQKKDLERNQQLFKKGIIAKQTLEAKEVAYLKAERNFVSLDASISQLEEAIHNVNINNNSTIIKQTKEEASLFKKVIQSFNQLKNALINWEMTYAITSDIDGRVAFSKPWTKNQNINQGDLLFTIIPEENSSYLAKLKTPPQNSGKLKKEQIVNIKLENYPDAEFGTLKGTVNSISLLPDQEGFYLVTVSLPKKLITSYKKEIPFRYEMRGSAEIITEDLRLIERFFYQFKNVLNN